MPVITNTMNRPWAVPNGHKAIQISEITIMPGMKASVPDQHWEAITKGNPALIALIDGKHLLVNGRGKEIDAEDLDNPETPEIPDDLKAENDPEDVTVEKTTELVEKVIPAAQEKSAGPKSRKG